MDSISLTNNNLLRVVETYVNQIKENNPCILQVVSDPLTKLEVKYAKAEVSMSPINLVVVRLNCKGDAYICYYGHPKYGSFTVSVSLDDKILSVCKC